MKSMFLVLMALLMCQLGYGVVTNVINDFPYNDTSWISSGSLGSSSWGVSTSTQNGFSARFYGNKLQLQDSDGHSQPDDGYTAAIRSIPTASGYNHILDNNNGDVTWYLRLRSPIAEPTGNPNGLIYVLASSSSTPQTSGSGYALIIGSSNLNDPLQLVRFPQGLLGSEIGRTDILISSSSVPGFENLGTYPYSVKVTYSPISDTWSLWARNEGTSREIEPWNGTLSFIGSSVDSSIIRTTSLPYTGAIGTTTSNVADGEYWEFKFFRLEYDTYAGGNLFVNPSELNFGTVPIVNPKVLSYTLSSDVLIDGFVQVQSQDSHFTVSLDNHNFSEYVTVSTGDDYIIDPTTIYVKFTPTNNFVVTSTIDQYNFGTPLVSVDVTGEGWLGTEPSHHVTNFTAVVGDPATSTIDLSWTDPSSELLPTGYLIKASSIGYNAITNPIDDNFYSEGLLQKHAVYGDQQISFSGLSQNTTYYFKIFPYYAYSGINYKTDPAAPYASATTSYDGTSPFIEYTGDPAFDFGVVEVMSNSVNDVFRGSGSNLSGNLVITVTGDFQISDYEDGVIWSQELSYVPTSGSVEFRAYIRARPVFYGERNGTLTLSSTGANTVSVPVTVFGLKQEPVGHAVNFAVANGNPGRTIINASWQSPPEYGIQPPPDAYLIRASSISYASIADPVDGTFYTDGPLQKVIPAGTWVSSFTGLNPGTRYYFKIFGYTIAPQPDETEYPRYLVNEFVPQASISTFGEFEYVWIGGETGLWGDGNNWNPYRDNFSPNDVMTVNCGGVVSITNVPREIIARLSIINDTEVNLTSSLAVNDFTLQIAGYYADNDPDVWVQAGSTLHLSGNNKIYIALVSTATAAFAGTLQMSEANHQLQISTAGSVHFRDLGVFINQENSLGQPFTALAQVLSAPVIFENGSTYIMESGLSPFGSGAVPSVSFAMGSTYQCSSNLDLAGRTYGHVIVNPSENALLMMTAPNTMSSLTLLGQTLSLYGNHQINVSGGLTVQNGANMAFSQGATLNLNGTSPQLISGQGNVSFAENTTLRLDNTSGMKVLAPLAVHDFYVVQGETTINSVTMTINNSVTGANYTPVFRYNGSGSLMMNTSSIEHTDAVLDAITNTDAQTPLLVDSIDVQGRAYLPNDINTSGFMIGLEELIIPEGITLAFRSENSFQSTDLFAIKGVGEGTNIMAPPFVEKGNTALSIGESSSLPISWTTTGGFNTPGTLVLPFPANLVTLNNVKVWQQMEGSWNDLGYFMIEPFTVSGNANMVCVNIPSVSSLGSIGKGPMVWTFGEGDDTLPVVLSSFTVTTNSANSIMLNWVTQSESGLMGYRVYRNDQDALSQALVVSDLIGATNTSQLQCYSFVDEELLADGKYYYWLESSEIDGSFDFFGPISIIYDNYNNNFTPPQNLISGVKNIYPNPFNPSTTISYELDKTEHVKLEVYNQKGQKIYTLADREQNAGTYRLVWDGTDEYGKTCASGVYILRFNSPTKSYNYRLSLVK